MFYLYLENEEWVRLRNSRYLIKEIQLKEPLLKSRKKTKPKLRYLQNKYLADLMSTVFEQFHLSCFLLL